MRETRRISILRIDEDAEQPRKHFDESELLALGGNLKAVGQLVPVIVYPVGQRVVLLDGARRWRAAQLVGITELDAVVLAEKPTVTTLHIVQISLEAHKVGLSAMERSDFLHRIREENAWSVTDLATNLQMKQPLVSKLLAYQRLCPEARRMLHAGEIEMDKALVVSAEADPEKQMELIKAAASCSREQLRRRARTGGLSEPKASSAKFVMPGGLVISLQGRDVTLTLAIEVLTEAVRMFKKGLSQGLDITTQQRVMRDTAKAGVK